MQQTTPPESEGEETGKFEILTSSKSPASQPEKILRRTNITPNNLLCIKSNHLKHHKIMNRL